jgi:hypothetical protein
MSTPEKPTKFTILEGIRPRTAPLSMQTSHNRALRRLRQNFASQPPRIKDASSKPDSVA